jgi:hypothetical protein
VDVRPQFRENRGWLCFREDGGEIDGFQSGDGFGAVLFANQRAQVAFDRPDAGVAVQADNKDVAQRLRFFETPHVADVEQIEAAVGPDDLPPRIGPGLTQSQKFVQRLDFRPDAVFLKS